MRDIALVTYLASAELSASDACLAAELTRRGVGVRAIPWDDPDADWSACAAAVIRSTWDYHHRPAEFSAWLDRLAHEGVRLWNPPAVVRWNLHKRYLLDLERAGVAVVPTELVEGRATLAAIAGRRGWTDVVVKPAIGASATGVRLLRAREVQDSQAWFEQAAASSDLLVQRAIPEIANGEWSLVFFGGEYSHAALKVPSPGDIRVQARYGGVSTVADAPPPFVPEAASVLRRAAGVVGVAVEDLLYARVDGVVVEGQFTLMELELIEPGLFLHLPGAGDAAARFADVLIRRIG